MFYQHNCAHCRYLGFYQETCEVNKVYCLDLYVCKHPDKDFYEYIARFGPWGQNYTSFSDRSIERWEGKPQDKITRRAVASAYDRHQKLKAAEAWQKQEEEQEEQLAKEQRWWNDALFEEDRR